MFTGMQIYLQTKAKKLKLNPSSYSLLAQIKQGKQKGCNLEIGCKNNQEIHITEWAKNGMKNREIKEPK